MGRKRANGEGGVSQRKDGRWQARYTPLAGGKRQYAYGRTQREVLDKLEDLKADDRSGKLVRAGRESFKEWMDHWIANVHRRKVRASTLGKDRCCIEKHVIPRLGGHPLAKLRPEHIEAFISQMELDGVGQRTIVKAFGFVRQALKQAVKARKIAWNPLDAVEAPRDPRTEATALDLDDIQKLLRAAEGHHYEALIIVGLHTGMRWGELAGLHWGDIDLDKGLISVRRAQAEVYDVSQPKGQRTRLVVDNPKTKSSERTISIGAKCVDGLRRHRTNLEAIPHRDRPVFTSPDGLPLRNGNFRKRQWKPLLRRAKLSESIKWHEATRHTCATLGAAQGVSPRVMQERLGHARLETTLAVYTHTTAELHERAADRLDAAMFDTNRDTNQGAQGRTTADSEPSK